MAYALYNLLFVPLLWLLVQGPGRLHPGIRRNLRVRRGLFSLLVPALRELDDRGAPRGPRVWIHCASMGEFEAVRPLAGRLKARGCRLLLSFYSSSGPEHLGRLEEFDFYCYLPLDTPRAARRFVGLLKPDLLLVTKHDLWPNHLRAARRAGARLLFINANFHSKSRLALRGMRPLNRAMLALFDLVAPVSESMGQRFQELMKGLDAPVKVLGETRFDRVVEQARESVALASIPREFHEGHPVLVLGSSWPPGEERLLPAFARLRAKHPGLRLLLVPHEPAEAQLAGVERRLADLDLPWRRLSALRLGPDLERGAEAGSWEPGIPVLLVDRVGLLAGLYACATLAYVGGGFTTGVHSVIEAAAFGIPVYFGPLHHVSQEAQYMLESGGGLACEGSEQFLDSMAAMLDDPRKRERAGAAALGLVQRCGGATGRIIRVMEASFGVPQDPESP